MKKNKILSFFSFIIIILIIGILISTLITALDILEIIDVPEKYSLTRFLKTSVKDYSISFSDLEKDKDEITSDTNNADPDKIVIEVPSQIQEVYDGGDNTETPALNPTPSGSGEEKPTTSENGKYYYVQLDDYGKIIYNKMMQNIENLKTGDYIVKFDTEFNDILQEDGGEKVMERAFQSALNALVYDNPGIFYLDITKMFLYTETTTYILKKTYKVSIGPEQGKTYFGEGFNSKEDVDAAIAQVNKKVEEIKFKLSSNSNNNIKIIHDYLIDTIEYDQTISQLNTYNIYGALINNCCVCEGYAKSMKYLMDQIGVETMFAFGIGTNSGGQTENHAWNYVKVNGVWYAIDCTWDDPIIVGGGSATNSHRYRYFLKGSDEFFKDHFEDGTIIEGVKFYYPTLSKTNY